LRNVPTQDIDLSKMTILPGLFWLFHNNNLNFDKSTNLAKQRSTFFLWRY